MENNEIMQRLLQDDKQSNSDRKVIEKQSNDKDTSISKIRIVTAKYKVYIVLLLIFIAILIFKFIPNANSNYEISKDAYSQARIELNNVEKDIEIANKDMDYLCNNDNWVITNEDALKKCLNENEDCSSLPESWKKWEWEDASYDFSIPLSYLQLHSLYNKKMPVDEKRVLKNLNEYLIKKEIEWGDRNKVWDILRIEIGDPEAIWYVKKNPNEWGEPIPNFFKVPVDVEIEFSTVEDLIWFLYNIEKKLIDDSKDRILYKIQTVSYDIVTKDEPQVTDISMIAYYYHDEKFNDKVECEENNPNNNSNESNNSDSNIDDLEQENSEEESESWDFDSIYQEVKQALGE